MEDEMNKLLAIVFVILLVTSFLWGSSLLVPQNPYSFGWDEALILGACIIGVTIIVRRLKLDK